MLHDSVHYAVTSTQMIGYCFSCSRVQFGSTLVQQRTRLFEVTAQTMLFTVQTKIYATFFDNNNLFRGSSGNNVTAVFKETAAAREICFV